MPPACGLAREHSAAEKLRVGTGGAALSLGAEPHQHEARYDPRRADRRAPLEVSAQPVGLHARAQPSCGEGDDVAAAGDSVTTAGAASLMAPWDLGGHPVTSGDLPAAGHSRSPVSGCRSAWPCPSTIVSGPWPLILPGHNADRYRRRPGSDLSLAGRSNIRDRTWVCRFIVIFVPMNRLPGLSHFHRHPHPNRLIPLILHSRKRIFRLSPCYPSSRKEFHRPGPNPGKRTARVSAPPSSAPVPGPNRHAANQIITTTPSREAVHPYLWRATRR
jgi:hypothetical protein